MKDKTPEELLEARTSQRMEELKLRGEVSIENEEKIRTSVRRKIKEAMNLTEDLIEENFANGTIVQGYKTISQLGLGSQSTAYLAERVEDQKKVVLKTMRIADLNKWEAYSAFQREAEVLALIDFPGLPHLVEEFTLESEKGITLVSVQEGMEGRNLEELLNEGMLFSEHDLKNIALQILHFLEYLHSLRPSILHRDIKPRNLLYSDEAKLSLIDFGAVQYADLSHTLAMGTVGYMPPEQLVGTATPQSDLYALGVTLVRLATRQLPSDLPLHRMHLDWRGKAALSDPFSDWIDGLIEVDVKLRWANASKALSALSNPTLIKRKPPISAPKSIVIHLVDDPQLVESFELDDEGIVFYHQKSMSVKRFEFSIGNRGIFILHLESFDPFCLENKIQRHFFSEFESRSDFESIVDRLTQFIDAHDLQIDVIHPKYDHIPRIIETFVNNAFPPLSKVEYRSHQLSIYFPKTQTGIFPSVIQSMKVEWTGGAFTLFDDATTLLEQNPHLGLPRKNTNHLYMGIRQGISSPIWAKRPGLIYTHSQCMMVFRSEAEATSILKHLRCFVELHELNIEIR